VACGTDHTIFITREGTAYATGFNSQGQLGLGHEDDVKAVQLIQGKALKDKILTWAGAGGQFSIMAARSKLKPAGGNLPARDHGAREARAQEQGGHRLPELSIEAPESPVTQTL
jgi:hypothetical protein